MFLSFLNRLRTSTQWLGPVCVFTKSVLAMFEKLRYLKSVLPPEARYGIDPVWRLPDGVNHFSAPNRLLPLVTKPVLTSCA